MLPDFGTETGAKRRLNYAVLSDKKDNLAKRFEITGPDDQHVGDTQGSEEIGKDA